MSSLPNLHPASVHFPIALLVVALLFDLGCLMQRRAVWLDRGAVALYVLGVLSGGLAAMTGKLAANRVCLSSEEAERLAGDHGDWAFATLLLFGLVALLRFDAVWRNRAAEEMRPERLRLVALALAVVGQWMLLETADRGAALVYVHGVAVRPSIERPASNGGEP